jgi:hypothetical protein
MTLDELRLLQSRLAVKVDLEGLKPEIEKLLLAVEAEISYKHFGKTSPNSNISKLGPITIEEAERIVRDVQELTLRPNIKLDFLEDLECKMVAYMCELEENPEWYQDQNERHNVLASYNYAVHLVMVRINEVRRNEAA